MYTALALLMMLSMATALNLRKKLFLPVDKDEEKGQYFQFDLDSYKDSLDTKDITSDPVLCLMLNEDGSQCPPEH
ncbi:hypothetical protein OS493_008673 [Desmophyllum pertusum]|uniref:Uncharacterized protein n=1 Tax=Desmophyllum pertusum TaxID=174260 RepID=A0A9W9ZRS3_9CNID|nr:hypothetical protein OS493_008673 [Desmophyllum pertusum]